MEQEFGSIRIETGLRGDGFTSGPVVDRASKSTIRVSSTTGLLPLEVSGDLVDGLFGDEGVVPAVCLVGIVSVSWHFGQARS